MSHSFTFRRSVNFALACACILLLATAARAQFYANKYAVIIGINQYTHPKWQRLNYARGDADGVAALMKELGFQVDTLFDAQATRSNIVSLLEDQIAPRLQKDDAVFFFFAGHGHTSLRGGKQWGYLIPVDATDKSGSFLDMETLQSLSEKMGNAKHQLFILDCCFGGLLAQTRGEEAVLNPNDSNFLETAATHIARQALTAGTENQRVSDSGPDGHSVFTGNFIQGIREGKADPTKKGWISFGELALYIKKTATSKYQTPVAFELPGHVFGEFLFQVPKRTPPAIVPQLRPTDAAKRDEAETVTEMTVLTTPSSVPGLYFRHTSITLSPEEAFTMVRDKDLVDKLRNGNGKGIRHQYHSLTRQSQTLMIDDATGLMWQQSGSHKEMDYANAYQYIRTLNNEKFAGYNDWRLPTLEEAMSLIEPTQKNSDLHIDPVFDKMQHSIWTIDKAGFDGEVWAVSFDQGSCGLRRVGDPLSVRAVRSGQ